MKSLSIVKRALPTARLWADALAAELSGWKRVSMTIATGNKELVARTLAYWKQDADLADIRDEPQLAKWPEDERAALKQLWNDVDALLEVR